MNRGPTYLGLAFRVGPADSTPPARSWGLTPHWMGGAGRGLAENRRPGCPGAALPLSSASPGGRLRQATQPWQRALRFPE